MFPISIEDFTKICEKQYSRDEEDEEVAKLAKLLEDDKDARGCNVFKRYDDVSKNYLRDLFKIVVFNKKDKFIRYFVKKEGGLFWDGIDMVLDARGDLREYLYYLPVMTKEYETVSCFGLFRRKFNDYKWIQIGVFMQILMHDNFVSGLKAFNDRFYNFAINVGKEALIYKLEEKRNLDNAKFWWNLKYAIDKDLINDLRSFNIPSELSSSAREHYYGVIYENIRRYDERYFEVVRYNEEYKKSLQ